MSATNAFRSLTWNTGRIFGMDLLLIFGGLLAAWVIINREECDNMQNENESTEADIREPLERLRKHAEARGIPPDTLRARVKSVTQGILATQSVAAASALEHLHAELQGALSEAGADLAPGLRRAMDLTRAEHAQLVERINARQE